MSLIPRNSIFDLDNFFGGWSPRVYNNGVLTLVAPKISQEVSSAKRIEIK